MTTGLMSLGMFVFQLQSVPLAGYSRNARWRYADGAELGRLPDQQFVGKADDTVSLTCQLRPEVTGPEAGLEQLRAITNDCHLLPR